MLNFSPYLRSPLLDVVTDSKTEYVRSDQSRMKTSELLENMVGCNYNHVFGVSWSGTCQKMLLSRVLKFLPSKLILEKPWSSCSNTERVPLVSSQRELNDPAEILFSNPVSSLFEWVEQYHLIECTDGQKESCRYSSNRVVKGAMLSVPFSGLIEALSFKTKRYLP